ncbi:MAG: hypothetical protein KatS3mg010_0800 [Acidimicrobiia bacterium]|nr:MAG: hypothetical protein KatS3mg010_0800 [Acidimicrobiia bacterium]
MKLLQIRNVPDDAHRTLEARAAPPTSRSGVREA